MLMQNMVLLNIANCVVFLVVVALNFRSALNAVRLFINKKRTGKDPDAGAQ